MKDIRNINSKGQSHGYQEWYGYHELIYRGNYKNNESIANPYRRPISANCLLRSNVPCWR